MCSSPNVETLFVQLNCGAMKSLSYEPDILPSHVFTSAPHNQFFFYHISNVSVLYFCFPIVTGDQLRNLFAFWQPWVYKISFRFYYTTVPLPKQVSWYGFTGQIGNGFDCSILEASVNYLSLEPFPAYFLKCFRSISKKSEKYFIWTLLSTPFTAKMMSKAFDNKPFGKFVLIRNKTALVLQLYRAI